VRVIEGNLLECCGTGQALWGSCSMSRFSIRAKVMAVIAFMLVAMSGMGLLAVRSMQTINGHTVEIAVNWLPSVRVLGELRADINLFRIALRAHVMAETPEDKATVDKRLAGILDSIAKDRTNYESLISSPEERELHDEWSRAWDKYQKGVQGVVEASRSSVGRIPHEASELLSKQVAVVAAESDALLKRSIDLNNAGADAATRNAAEGYNVAFYIVVSIVLAAIVSGVGVGFYLVRDLSRGIASIVKPMQSLGRGDLAAEVPHRGEQTEIGAMADVLQVFKQALIAKRAADEAAARDAEAKIARGRRVDGLTRKFEAMIGEIVETVSSASTELEASASTLTSTAERAQELATTVASASEEASTNVQSVASATEEMASSVNEISRQVQESARIASEAVDQARKTNDRVSELSKAAARIGDVVELINTIAGQTNLLALNATIEAARAGEAGRGFAVVASEVKALAEQTAKATGEIGQQVAGIQAATQDSVGAIQEISGTIEKLSEIATVIAAAVEEQGAATQEISRNVQQAASGTQQVSANISDVQRGATETETASSQVLSAAQSLSSDSNRLKLEVGNFLESVRAA
jgi:methyl-accepting chemotaxis protein